MNVKKSSELASEFKTLGNSHFKKFDRRRALECYTKAIMLTPYNPEEIKEFLREGIEALSDSKKQVAEAMSLDQSSSDRAQLLPQCYGNRSAILFELEKYEECLADIEQAIKLGFPSSQVSKLHRRRDKCLAKLKEVSGAEEDEIRPAGEGGYCNAYQSTSVSVSSSSSKGRHLIASRDIEAGEIILSELPYSAVLEEDLRTTHCSFCFKECSFNLVPCMTCACEGYCSSKCRRQAWLDYHWLECTQASWKESASWMEILCLRTVIATGASDIGRILTGQSLEKSSGGEYGFICDLEAHEHKFSRTSDEMMLKRMAASLVRGFGDCILKYALPAELKPSEEPSHFEGELPSRLESLFLRHLLQLRCNTHVVSDLCAEKEADISSELELDRAEGSGGAILDGILERRLGRVLLPTASLINHSCLPNSYFRFIGSTVQVCVTKSVKNGQEICTSYGPQVGRQKTSLRRTELLEKFFFHCKCEACSGLNLEVMSAEAALEGLACLHCEKGALACVAISNEESSAGGGSWTCCSCGGVEWSASLEERLYKNIELKDKAEALFQLASSKRALDLSMLLECHRIQSGVLHRYNKALARTSDKIAQEYAARGEFILSGHYLELSCGSVAARYGRHSIEYGNELQKLAAILLHSGQLKLALKAAQNAMDILVVFKGPDSPECLEVNAMLKFLSSST